MGFKKLKNIFFQEKTTINALQKTNNARRTSGGHPVRTAPNGASLTQPAAKPTKRTSERNKIEASVFGSINEKISSMV